MGQPSNLTLAALTAMLCACAEQQPGVTAVAPGHNAIESTGEAHGFAAMQPIQILNRMPNATPGAEPNQTSPQANPLASPKAQATPASPWPDLTPAELAPFVRAQNAPLELGNYIAQVGASAADWTEFHKDRELRDLHRLATQAEQKSASPGSHAQGDLQALGAERKWLWQQLKTEFSRYQPTLMQVSSVQVWQNAHLALDSLGIEYELWRVQKLLFEVQTKAGRNAPFT